MITVIGIGEYAISTNILDRLKTFALASCVAVTAYCPLKQVAAMIHIALPAPASVGEWKKRPAYYAATGIPIMIGKLCSEYGCNMKELRIQIYGGADSAAPDDVFNIGKKNIKAVCEILESLGLRISKEETGGRVCRTIELDVATGEIKVWTQDITI